MSRPIYPALVREVARLGRSKTGDNQQRDDQRHEAGSSHEGTSRLMIEITNVTWDGNATARPPAGRPQCTNVAHLGPPAMSAFLPLLGDKRTSNAPSPGVPIYEYTTPKGVYYDDADRYPLSPHKRRKSGHFLTAVREDRRRPTGQQRRRRWR